MRSWVKLAAPASTLSKNLQSRERLGDRRAERNALFNLGIA
jgi:hypothetical protein